MREGDDEDNEGKKGVGGEGGSKGVGRIMCIEGNWSGVNPVPPVRCLRVFYSYSSEKKKTKHREGKKKMQIFVR